MKNNTIIKWFSMLLLVMAAGISGVTAQTLAIDGFSIKAGETKDVTIKLEAQGPIYAIQTDVVVSEGLTIEKEAATNSDLTFVANTVSTGARRMAQLSLAGNEIPVGDVITLTMKASESFNGGTIQLTNTRLSTSTSGTEVKANDVTANVTLDQTLVYSVAGSPANLFGAEWDEKATATEMTLNAETGLYEWSASNVSLPKGKVEFKVVVNHSWNLAYPSQNYELQIESDGIYDIAITFNEETMAINATATKKDDVVIEKVYSIAGEPETLFGANWDELATATVMTLNAETGFYEWSKSDVTLNEGLVKFRIVENHSWNNAWPEGSGNNYELSIPETAIYTILITFDETNGIVDATATKTGDIVIDQFDVEKVAIDPVDHSIVESLQNFTLTFGGQKVTVNAKMKPTIGDVEGEIALNDDGSVSITFAEAITAPGSYTLEIPSGAILFNGTAIDPLSFTYTIGGVSFTIDPAPGVVESLTTFSVMFSNIVELDDNAKAYLFNEETEAEISANVMLIGGDKMVYVSLDEEVTAPGEWQLNIEGVKDQDGNSIELIFGYTIKDNTPDMNYYILGDFWGWDNPKQMEAADVENVYTLVIDFTAEAKKYEYKLRQGDNWQGYQLPANGNYDYTFTEAGDYTLTFTANVSEHTLTLDAVKKGQGGSTTYTVTVAQTEHGTVTVDKDTATEGETVTVTVTPDEGYKVDEAYWTYGETTNEFQKPQDGGNAATFTMPAANVTVVITFKPDENPYSVIFKTNAGWDDVYAYVWSGNGENEVLGKWPGKKLSYNERYDQYELSFKAVVAPEFIIFNNGDNGEQTTDLAFENQKIYEYYVEKPLIANGTYYIKNVATGKFLAAGSNWGTHAVVNETGLDFIVTAADGKYKLDSQVSNGGDNHYLSGEWTDSNGSWDVAEVSEGVFTFSQDGKFMTAGSDDRISLADDATVESAQWTLVPAAERAAANLATLDAATAENGVDATFLIKGANFNRNDQRNSAWVATKSGGNQTIAGPNADRGTYGCESWNNTFDVHQVIENIPEGVYEFTIAGYGTNGTTYVYANEAEAAFVNTTSAADFGTALDNIAAGQYTGNTTGKVNVIGGTLKIGVKRTSQVGQDWAVFDNARLTYYGPVPASEFKAAYEAALAAAQAALDNEDYANVTGDEKTALEQAITDNTNVEDTADAYKAAIQAIEEAMSAFKDAKAAYDGLAAAKADVTSLTFSYATAEKKAAAEATLEATAQNAEDATAKTAVVYQAYRQYAESSALLEGVEGATDFTSSIVNPKAESAIADPWVVVKGEGSGGSLGILDGEPWTDGDGNSAHKYFDGGNWGAQSWDVSLKQDVKLPKGRYQLTVKSRASADMSSFVVFAGETKTEMQHIGNTGGLFNNGWNEASIVFEVTEAGPVNIGVQGVTETVHNWMSFSDFRLVKFESYEPVYTVVGGFNTTDGGAEDVIFGTSWDPAIEANNMVKGEGDLYTKKFENVELEAGTIYYKVVGEHSWNYASWGFDGDNADYVVEEAGKYDITFTFNPADKLDNGYNLTCLLTKTGTTGINAINADIVNGAAFYNMNGQKVQNPTKGLYIIRSAEGRWQGKNGKKVVIK